MKNLNSVLTVYTIGQYRPYKGYSGNKARAILKSLGSEVALPKKQREVLVIETDLVQVYLVNDSHNRTLSKAYDYYFREVLKARIHVTKVVKTQDVTTRVMTEEQALAWLRKDVTPKPTLKDLFKS